MTTFLARKGVDLAIASVIAPLTSYGLHRMIPAPDVHFIAVASMLNIHVGLALRDLTENLLPKNYMILPQAKKQPGSVSNTNFICERLGFILHISAVYLLPIFTRYVGQKAGVQVPDYISLMGYIGITTGTFWAAKHCIDILYEVYYPKTAKK